MAFVTELLGYIGLDVDEQSFDRAQFNITGMIKGLGGIIAAAGAVDLTIKGITLGLVNSFANTATEIDQLTKRLNVNAEAFQATAFAAKSFGIEQDQLADGMKELSMRAGEFALDGKANADAFGEIGITQAQVKQYGNNIEGLFSLVRNKLSEVKEQGKRQFLADALFGGGLADVGGEFFSQTSEKIAALQKQARESGMVISQDNLDMAREYTREMDLLQARIKGLWNIVASRLLPVFTRITRQMKEFFDLHGEDIVDALTAAINGLTTAIKYLGIAAAIATPYLIGSAAIASWAKLIALTNTLTGAFLAMRTGALLAWAAAAAGPALVGAAIISLILVIQDIYTYFTGGDSITGRIIEAFGKPMVDGIKKAWSGLKQWFKDWIADVGQWFADLIPDWLKTPAIKSRQQMIESGQGDPNTKQSTFAYPAPDAHGITEPRTLAHDAPGITEPRVLVTPRITVTAPPTMAQGLAQANAGRGNVITTNSGNTTVGEIIVNGAENPVATAQAIRQELRRDNASRTKGTDTGVKY